MKGKTVLITGANRGIGLNILQKLDHAGYTVLGTSRTDEGIEIISSSIKNSDGKGIIMDVTNQESIDNAVSLIKEEFGTLYGLVNNAGITQDNLLMRMTDEQWLSVIDSNLTSLYRVTKAVIKDMIKAKIGRIVNIGSIVGVTGNAGQSNYSATKSGLLGFTKSLARELSSRNINVNSISPGFIETDMTNKGDGKLLESWIESIPLKRAGNVDDIANLCVYLASDKGSYITGQIIKVDGGLVT